MDLGQQDIRQGIFLGVNAGVGRQWIEGIRNRSAIAFGAVEWPGDENLLLQVASVRTENRPSVLLKGTDGQTPTQAPSPSQ